MIEERTSDITRNQGYIIGGIVALIVGLIGNFLYGNLGKRQLPQNKPHLMKHPKKKGQMNQGANIRLKGEPLNGKRYRSD